MQVAGGFKDELLPPPPPPPPKFLQMKQSSKGEASFRVMYYGSAAAGAVPFTWESCPGTPKHPLLYEENSLLPPLTPPPSYLSSSTPTRINSHNNNKSTKSKILGFDFFHKSKSTSEKPLFSTASFTSSSSVPSRNNLYANKSGNNWRSRSIVHYSFNDDEDDKTPAKASAMPTFCFGGSGRRSGAAGGKSGMLRRVKNVKKKILLIVGGNGTL